MKLEPPDFTFLTPGIKDDSFEILPGENLPIWICDRAIYHIVFHLADSVPSVVRNRLAAEREEALREIGVSPAMQTDPDSARAAEARRIRRLFSEKIDRLLDAGTGISHMLRPDVADVIEGALLFENGRIYDLYEYAVMPNHVHVIAGFATAAQVRKTISSLKGYTAKEINRITGRKGPVWAVDTYTRIIRTEREFRFQRDYVRKNPQRAGLVGWRWVSE